MNGERRGPPCSVKITYHQVPTLIDGYILDERTDYNPPIDENWIYELEKSHMTKSSFHGDLLMLVWKPTVYIGK